MSVCARSVDKTLRQFKKFQLSSIKRSMTAGQHTPTSPSFPPTLLPLSPPVKHRALWNWWFSSGKLLPLIPSPLLAATRRAGRTVLPRFPLHQNNYGIVLIGSTFTSPSRSPLFLRLTLYGTVVNGRWVYRLSFSRSLSLCEWRYGVRWIGYVQFSLYSRFQKAVVLWRVV